MGRGRHLGHPKYAPGVFHRPLLPCLFIGAAQSQNCPLSKASMSLQGFPVLVVGSPFRWHQNRQLSVQSSWRPSSLPMRVRLRANQR